jgi:hypothetical protein
MEHIRLGHSVVVFADVLKPGGCAVVSIRDYHLVLDNQGAYLAAVTIGVLCPNLGHSDIAFIE